jgi:hypothetical protein
VPSKVVSILVAVGFAASLSACGSTPITGAVASQDVQSQNIITTPAPGESKPAVVAEKAQCKGGVVGPTTVTKEFYSTSSVSAVKNFYMDLAKQGQWFLRDSGGLLLNYSMERGEQYWQLHINLASTADGAYQIVLEAYNPQAHC